MSIPPRNAGIPYYRKLLDRLEDSMVNWQPYMNVMHLMPSRVQEQREVWATPIPLIHFWIVEHYYPDRVMRQFGLRQIMPIPQPISHVEHRKLHKTRHVGKTKDWSREHADYIRTYRAAFPPEDSGPFDVNVLPQYRAWYQSEGMFSVFLDAQHMGGMRDPLPVPKDSTDWSGFVPSGPPVARMVF